MKKTNKKSNYQFGTKNQNVNLNAKEQQLIDELNKGVFTCCDGEIEFMPKNVIAKTVEGSRAVVVKWDQLSEVLPGVKVPLTGTTGFYVTKDNELKVINFDSNSKFMNDIAGATVNHIADLIGCTTNYDRRNPDTFKVVYI